MQKRIGMALTVAGLAMVPALAQAQARGGMGMGEMPKNEFGVDIGIGYTSPSGGQAQFGLAAPFGDIRVGFVTAKNMSLEGRLKASFLSGGGTFVSFDPGVNVLFKLGRGTGHHNMMGPYWTVGGDVDIISGGGTSGAVITINGGVGTRMAWGAAAKRVEGFVSYSLKNTALARPNTLTIGARLGLSFWK